MNTLLKLASIMLNSIRNIFKKDIQHQQKNHCEIFLGGERRYFGYNAGVANTLLQKWKDLDHSSTTIEQIAEIFFYCMTAQKKVSFASVLQWVKENELKPADDKKRELSYLLEQSIRTGELQKIPDIKITILAIAKLNTQITAVQYYDSTKPIGTYYDSSTTDN